MKIPARVDRSSKHLRRFVVVAVAKRILRKLDRNEWILIKEKGGRRKEEDGQLN